MHDNQMKGADTGDILIHQVLSNDYLLVHELLGDIEVKKAIISELKDISVPAPGIVYRLLVFAFGGCERFLGGAIKSRLKAYIDNNALLAGVLTKILFLQHGAKEKAELKNSLLASFKGGKRVRYDTAPNEACSLETIVSLHTAKRIEELNDHIEQLGDEVIKGFRCELANQLNQLVAPDLGWRDEVVSPQNLTAFGRLMYTSGIDSFLGREYEIDLLHRFVGDPSFGGRLFNFRWMLLTGDAGTGKTRLAYEFTRKRLNGLWYTGKLDFHSPKAFDSPSKWRPVKPTFIVVDYVQSVPEEVHALLLAFSTQAANYEFPVRLLLLERNANASWTDKLLPESGDKPVIEQHNFGDESVLGREIAPLSSQAIVELMKRRIEKAQLDVPEPSKLLSLANSVDRRETQVKARGQSVQIPTPRPLFAIATAEAIIEAITTGQELPEQFKHKDVLSDIVKRDRDMIWRKVVKNDRELQQYERGLAVATLTQGISLDDLKEYDFKGLTDWLPFTPPNHDMVSLAAFGYDKDRRLWPPLEPDILGEFFVSEQLLNLDLPKKQRIELIESALLLGNKRTINTLFRMARDFPESVEKLPVEDVARVTASGGILLSLTALAIDLIHHRLIPEVASRIFNAVLGNEVGKNSPVLGMFIAGAAVNIMDYACEVCDRDRVNQMSARIDALRRAFPQDLEIARQGAKAPAVIIKWACEVGDWDQVAEMLVRLDALRKTFSQDREIAETGALVEVNISKYAGAARNGGRIAEVLVRIDALRNAFPQDQGIALAEAMVAVNISKYAGEACDWGRVSEIVARIDELRNAFSQDQVIALAEAKIMFNISNYAGEAGDWERVTEMLGRLDTLRKAFPQDLEIAQKEAMIAVNISICAGEAGDWKRVAEMSGRLDALRNAFPQDQGIARAAAMAAFNISNLSKLREFNPRT